jgi:hypothetical protein
MPKRTLAILAAAAFGALAVPFGLPTIAAAAGATYTNLVLSPLPIAQPGSLNPANPSTNTVLLCVQPQANNVHVGPTAQVFLSIDSGLFTAPPEAGGSAVSGSTTLTATPTLFTVSATCTYDNANGVGTSTEMDAVPVTYTGPNPVPLNGRDVIVAADSAADVTGGQCNGTGVCNTGTYVFSPVASYVFSPAAPIAPTGSLTAGEQVTYTVTAEDGQGNEVPGAFMDISLSSTAVGGSATVTNALTHNATQHVTNTPVRFQSTNQGTASVTYTAASPLVTNDTDTITIQNHPSETLEASNTYAYGGTIPFTQGPYTPVAPFRICDTRPAGGGVAANQCNAVGEGPIGSDTSRALTVDGLGGVPGSGVHAVVLNVTAIAPSLKTFLTLYPAGGSRPGTSNVNPNVNQTVANLVEVAVGTGGQIELFNDQGTINVAVDVEGYVSSTGSDFNAVAPSRICDTRAAGGGVPANQCNTGGLSPIAQGGTLTFNVHTATDGVPAIGVTAVVFNLTAINPSSFTVLTAYEQGTTRPNASNLNLNANTAVPNRVIVPVSAGGEVTLWNSLGSVNVAVDVNGYFSSTGAQFTALTPARICNTQNGNVNDAGCSKGLIPAGSSLNIAVDGIDGVPPLTGPHTPTAVVINVTAVNATTGTFVTVYPGPVGAAAPNASDLNEPTFEPVTNLVVVEVGSDGTINLFNDLGNVNLIVDVFGYYS